MLKSIASLRRLECNYAAHDATSMDRHCTVRRLLMKFKVHSADRHPRPQQCAPCTLNLRCRLCPCLNCAHGLSVSPPCPGNGRRALRGYQSPPMTAADLSFAAASSKLSNAGKRRENSSGDDDARRQPAWVSGDKKGEPTAPSEVAAKLVAAKACAAPDCCCT